MLTNNIFGHNPLVARDSRNTIFFEAEALSDNNTEEKSINYFIGLVENLYILELKYI